MPLRSLLLLFHTRSEIYIYLQQNYYYVEMDRERQNRFKKFASIYIHAHTYTQAVLHGNRLFPDTEVAVERGIWVNFFLRGRQTG